MEPGRQSAFSTFGMEAASLASLTWWMVAGAIVIFIGVATLMVLAMRAREGELTHTQGMKLVLWAGGVLPTIVLLTLLVTTLPQMRPLQAAPADLRIAVQGEQFWWRVRYQPAGGRAEIDANEVRVPVGRRVVFQLTAGDVLHSFWVPGLAGKMDMVPGRTNTLVVQATKAGRFRGQCAEFCGLSHALMAFDVIAMEPAAFDRWLASRRLADGAQDGPVAERGGKLFADYGCAGCHSLRDTAFHETIGPDLTQVGSRSTVGAGVLPMSRANLVRFIREAPSVKPGARMPAYPHMSAADASALAAYMETLK